MIPSDDVIMRRMQLMYDLMVVYGCWLYTIIKVTLKITCFADMCHILKNLDKKELYTVKEINTST